MRELDESSLLDDRAVDAVEQVKEVAEEEEAPVEFALVVSLVRLKVLPTKLSMIAQEMGIQVGFVLF